MLVSRLKHPLPPFFRCIYTESTSDLVDGKYGSDSSTKLIYGIFTTPTNSIGGSAVCAFSLQDIADTFEGNFKEQGSITSNWLPVKSEKVTIFTCSTFLIFPFLLSAVMKCNSIYFNIIKRGI